MADILFDFDSIQQRIIANLKTKESWKNILFTSTNNILIDSFAEEEQELARYNTYLTRENTWKLAMNKNSLIALSDIHNYKPLRKISSRGKIRLSASKTFDSVPPKNITIEKNSIVATSNDISFIIPETYSITTNLTYIDVDIVQGILQSYTITSLGNDYERVIVSNPDIENSYFNVYVNGILYDKVDSLYDSEATDKVYEIGFDIDTEGIIFKFGNGIFGNKLVNGDVIRVEYLESKGIDGNILSAGIIKNFNSIARDIDSNSVTIYCKNVDKVIGGSNEESIESIRVNAPNYFQTGDKAITVLDYKTLISKNINFVKKVIVWGIYEINIDNDVDMWTYLPSEENLVYISVIDTTGENINTEQKNTISNMLLNYKNITDILKFEDSDIIEMVFDVYAYVKDKQYLLSTIKSNISNNLQSNYNLDVLDYFEHIYYSDYYTLLDQTIGVDHHISSVKLKKTFTFNTAYNFSGYIPLYEIAIQTVNIYVYDVDTMQKTLICVDNGIGGFTAQPGYNVDGSSVNYSNGLLNILINSGLTKPIDKYKLFVYWKTIDQNIMLKKRWQILKYNNEESVINAEYMIV